MKRVRVLGETFTTDVVKERYGGEGCTLGAYMAEAANGVDLVLDDPYGVDRTVSLAPFAGEDPNRWLLFKFLTSEIGFDHLDHGNAVVLAEYDLPDGAEAPKISRPTIGDSELLKKYSLPPGARMIGE